MSEKIHIYFVPGMATGSEIFEFIKLPSDRFELHFLEWLIPESMHESLEHYVERLSKFVEHKDPVLVGVSFGGVVVQEMKKFVNPQKIIIISSIKSRDEMSKSMHIAKKLNLDKWLPISFVSDVDRFERYALLRSIRGKLHHLKKYLNMRDTFYLPWALHNVINWDRTEIDSQVEHIHGTKDFIFPIKNIKNCIEIDGGNHVMILIKAKKISSLLEELIG